MNNEQELLDLLHEKGAAQFDWYYFASTGAGRGVKMRWQPTQELPFFTLTPDTLAHLEGAGDKSYYLLLDALTRSLRQRKLALLLE